MKAFDFITTVVSHFGILMGLGIEIEIEIDRDLPTDILFNYYFENYYNYNEIR